MSELDSSFIKCWNHCFKSLLLCYIIRNISGCWQNIK